VVEKRIKTQYIVDKKEIKKILKKFEKKA